MPAPLAIIFDVDGVLVDSYEHHLASWQQACRDFNLRVMTEAEFVATFGRTSREVIAATWPERSLSAEESKQFDEHKEALFRDLLAANFTPMPGAVELIDSLAAAGFRIAAGSSAPPPNVWLSLERLGRRERFEAVVTGADVTRGKPDPQVFLLAAERLGISPARCCVVEDAPAGVEAALAAGMKCVGLASRGRTVEQLRRAHRVVSALSELSPTTFAELLG